jgi:hypothetical protein
MTSLDPYATTLLGIKNAVKAVIDSTETFHDKVSFDYISAPAIEDNPFAHCSIVRDSLKAWGIKETGQLITFNIDIVYICAPDESELDKLIGYIGEVIDALEGDRHMGAEAYVDRVEVDNVTYGFIEGDQALVRTGRIGISVHSMRNM